MTEKSPLVQSDIEEFINGQYFYREGYHLPDYPSVEFMRGYNFQKGLEETCGLILNKN